MGEYEVKKGDNLYNIAKTQYKLDDKKQIMSKAKDIAKKNNIKNPNLIFSGQKLELNEELKLNSVSLSNPETDGQKLLKDNTGNTNYYRSNSVFGDIATKPDEYKNQPFEESDLRKITQSTKEVEDVVVDVSPEFTSDTARDLQAYDIAAKPSGVGGFKDMNNSDAYKMFLKVNAGDFTVRETEYKGKKEAKAYLDREKTDGKITVFSSEIVNNKEYLAMRDENGKVHYFDKEDGLKEEHFDR